MQKILQEAKEKDLGMPEGNFKLYPGELLDIDREQDISLHYHATYLLMQGVNVKEVSR